MTSILDQIATSQGRRDEVPNQELARRLAEARDQAGIQEIAENLWNADPNVQSDCIKVLYEVGYLEPALIAPYAADFLRLLHSRQNRLVWGGMIALSTIAGVAADAIDPQRDQIQRAMERGSVITVDAGVLTLARLASTSAERRQAIFPYLLHHLETCRPKDVPQHAEKTLVAVDGSNKDAFVKTLENRMSAMRPSEASRLKRAIKQAKAR